MNTEYKGFTIHKLKVNFHVAANGFNPKGYASLTAAKGAITKHLKGEAIDQFLEKATSLPASSNDANHASMTASLEDDVGNGEDALISLDARGHSPLASKAKQSDKRSRNQREGRYAGTVDGKPHRYYAWVLELVSAKEIRARESFTTEAHTKTRKQRKARKMNPESFSQFF